MAEPTNESIKAEERLIGLRAAKMVEAYMLAGIKQKLHKGISVGAESLEDGSRVKHKMGDYRLLGLNITAPIHGFILHYGFVGVREATAVYLTAPRYIKTKTQRKSHQFNMPAKNIFEEIYNKSGVIPYLVEELATTRIAAVEIKINDMVLKFNRENDGR